MNTLRFSTQCEVRQCSQCQGDTDFYCNKCKHDLCLPCKERHDLDLDTIYHDVVIYRERYENVLKQETCPRHPDRIYQIFCQSCELPVCFQCKEHREDKIFLFSLHWKNHKKHKIQDVRKTYKKYRQHHREIIHNIRSECLYKSCLLLTGIKTDIKTCHIEICNRQTEMSAKAKRLKDLIDSFIDRYTNYFMLILQKRRKINRHITSIANYEHKWDQLINRPVKFLSFLKQTHVPKIKDIPYLTHVLLPLTEEINIKDVIILLSEIQIIETGKRQVRNECMLKLMSTPVLYRSVRMTGVSNVRHISCLTSAMVWINDQNNLLLKNTEGDSLYQLTDIKQFSYTGVHTVDVSGNVIYIDRDNNINKLSIYNRTKCRLLKTTGPWIPCSVYFSPSNGDLLVGMWNTDTKSSRVTRYNDTGKHIHTIQNNNKGQKLYNSPIYVTENRNGDVIVSDWDRAVVVTNCGGRHRFSYTGPPSGSGLWPLGICTDALSHILVCDYKTDTVQMIDKDGYFISLILTPQQGRDRPYILSYDNKAHLLWVGSYINNEVCVYRYMERQNYLTGNCN